MCAIVDGMNVGDSPRAQPSAAVERRAEPRIAGHPSQLPDRGGIARPAPLGLIPYWCNDPKRGRKPINAKCETVRDLPTFRERD
jgi:putative SOS response-associated peptidase YedK